MKVWDCTQFFQENDVYEIRLHQHWDFVDHFIVTEAGETHTGRKKPFNFDHKRFEPFKEKLHYVNFPTFEEEMRKYPWLMDDVTKRHREDTCVEDWIRDYFQFNYMYKMLLELDAKNEDIVIFSPCDEILKRSAFDEAVKLIKDPNFRSPRNLKPVLFFDTYLYMYKINLQHHSDTGEYACASMTEFSNFKKMLPGTMRETMYWNNRTHANIKNAGWHFSSICAGKGEMLLEKYRSWSHSRDVNAGRDKIKFDLKTPEEAIERMTQDFGNIFKPIPITYDTHPRWVVDNQDKLQSVIYKE